LKLETIPLQQNCNSVAISAYPMLGTVQALHVLAPLSNFQTQIHTMHTN
jgi:hypothetical protein